VARSPSWSGSSCWSACWASARSRGPWSVRWPAIALLGGVLLAGTAVLLTGGDSGSAVRAVAEARVNLASPDRTGALHAALRLVAQQPMTGTGPGHADLRWKGQDHGTQLFAYVHNEYLQVTAELGLVGLALLAVLLVAIARLLWRARPTGRGGPTWAGAAAAAAAFAVHSGFDFVWHLPARRPHRDAAGRRRTAICPHPRRGAP
jgi:O-antigen ligase